MTIASVVCGGFGPAASIPFVVCGGFGVGATAPATRTHRAQYGGIQPWKKKKLARAKASEPERVLGRAVLLDPARVTAQARGGVIIRGRGRLTDAAQGYVTGTGHTISRGRATLKDDSRDTLRAHGTVTSDEDEALSALFNLMPWLKNIVIKEDA